MLCAQLYKMCIQPQYIVQLDSLYSKIRYDLKMYKFWSFIYRVFGYCCTNYAEWKFLLWVHKSCPENQNSMTHSFQEKVWRLIFQVCNELPLYWLKESNVLHYSRTEYIIAMQRLPIVSDSSGCSFAYRHTPTIHLFLNCFPVTSLWRNFCV